MAGLLGYTPNKGVGGTGISRPLPIQNPAMQPLQPGQKGVTQPLSRPVGSPSAPTLQPGQKGTGQPLNRPLPIDTPAGTAPGTITGTGRPPGVTEAQWSNPTWRAIWTQRNPNWKPSGAQNPVATGPATGPVPPPTQPGAGIPPGVTPEQWNNPAWRSIWLRNNPNWQPSSGALTPGQKGITQPLNSPLPIQNPGQAGLPTGQQVTTPGVPQTPAWQGAGNYFDPNKATVHGQLGGLLDPGNPLMQQAQTRALKAANSRGLSNSTMAVQAGESAMLDAALPIAAQDAQTYQAMNMLDADYDFKMDFLNKQQQFEQIAQGLNLSSQEKQQMTATLGSLFNGVLSQVGSVLRDKELDGPAMEAAIAEIYRGYQDTVATYADLFGYNINWNWSNNNATGG